MTFARHGATVILHGRNVAKLEATYDAMEGEGLKQPAILPLDFLKTTQAELDAFAQSIHSTLGRLDGIFHAAGHFISPMPMALNDLDMWNKHTTVNLTVPAALTKSCQPLLKRSPEGSVVFLTETHAVHPKAYWGPFAVSKSALASLVAILADEVESGGSLRFNLCLPGPVATPMRAQSHPGELASELAEAVSLEPDFLYLMGRDSAAHNGCLLESGGSSIDRKAAK